MKGMHLLCNRHANAFFAPAGGAPLSYIVYRPQMTLHLGATDHSSRHQNKRR
jgi:hypothetical protein